MVALRIEDLKGFTSKLFIGDTFDRWLVREATVTTFNTFTIDGHMRQGYYSDEELEERQIGEFSSWKMLRPVCFSLIKGKRLPGSFHITLQLSSQDAERFLQHAQLDFTVEQIAGLYLNVRYEGQVLRCVSGMSLRVFTLDRQIEMEWDEAVRLYLKQQQIPYVEA